MGLPIITKINDKKHFQQMIDENPGVLIIKFGATWCGPCKKIEKEVNEYVVAMPNNVQCAIVDIDECMEVYGFLRTKKMVKTIPAMLGYYKENNTYIPDEFVSSSNVKDVKIFFDACLEEADSQ